MTLAPFTVARYGLYAALVVAAASIWLGYRAGASLDYVVLRSVVVFVIFAVLAFAAEAVLTVSTGEAHAPAPPDQRRPSAGTNSPGDNEPAGE